MNTQSEIRTSPGWRNWLGWVCGIIFFGAIVAILPLMALDYLYLHSPKGRPPVDVCRIIGGIGAIVAGWIMLRVMDRLYWCLSKAELIGGRRGNLRLPLSCLDKIVIGLPNKFLIPGMEKVALPHIRASSILLCFSDGSLLPMHLHGMPNGSLLMNELVSRFSERVDENYSYSEEEVKILRKAEVNVLIRKARP